MKICVLLLVAVIIFGSCASAYVKSSSYSHQNSPIHTDGSGRIWKTRTEWKFRWVKEWKIKKIYVPIWKKVWTPVEIKEWLPLPRALHK
ncbi:uncharacterized protein LOC143198382 [Rhynchophorus ferrugineus]|uniref:uncharacterized protein LOC143198382 n=1 Tax=Rhynchophorus ferrugineus TaxID=354439 RepID=UPI003FCD2749